MPWSDQEILSINFKELILQMLILDLFEHFLGCIFPLLVLFYCVCISVALFAFVIACFFFFMCQDSSVVFLGILSFYCDFHIIPIYLAISFLISTTFDDNHPNFEV